MRWCREIFQVWDIEIIKFSKNIILTLKMTKILKDRMIYLINTKRWGLNYWPKLMISVTWLKWEICYTLQYYTHSIIYPISDISIFLHGSPLHHFMLLIIKLFVTATHMYNLDGHSFNDLIFESEKSILPSTLN